MCEVGVCAALLLVVNIGLEMDCRQLLVSSLNEKNQTRLCSYTASTNQGYRKTKLTLNVM